MNILMPDPLKPQPLSYLSPAPVSPDGERMPRWLEIAQIVLLIVGPILMFLFGRRR